MKCSGFAADEPAARAISAFFEFEGRRQEASECEESRAEMAGSSSSFEMAGSSPSFGRELAELDALHRDLYRKMREASPEDDSMGKHISQHSTPPRISMFRIIHTLQG